MQASPRLYLQVLGPVEARLDDQPISLGSRLQRACLTVLLCHVNRPVSCDVLVEALGGASAPNTGHQSVQRYIYGLRQVLDAPTRISHGPQGYTLHMATDELDLLRFRELAETARRTRASGRDSIAAELSAQALGLWRGRPGRSVGIDGVEAEFEPLRLEHLAVFEDWAEARLEVGEPAQVAEQAQRLVVDHPLRERLRAVQIRALFASGRQREAGEAFDDLCHRLACEIGLEPSSQLTTLYRSLVEQA